MNKHRWAGWVDERTKHVLWAAREHLKNAWDSDRKGPLHYPLNMSFALGEIEQAVANRVPNKKKRISFRKYSKPRTLAELVPEGQIRWMWEDYNTGTFKDAIGLAAQMGFDNTKKSWKIFQTIIRAMEAAYLSKFLGFEVLSKPKVNILHKGLEQIARTAGLHDQTNEGFAEFLDDLCPCGLKRHIGAVRKLSERSARVRRRAV